MKIIIFYEKKKNCASQQLNFEILENIERFLLEFLDDFESL